MHFAGFTAIALLLASSSAAPTKRQALLDTIGSSSLEDVVTDIKDHGNVSLLGDLIEVAIDALSHEASAVAECYAPDASSKAGSGSSSSGSSNGAGSGTAVGSGAGTGSSSSGSNNGAGSNTWNNGAGSGTWSNGAGISAGSSAANGAASQLSSLLNVAASAAASPVSSSGSAGSPAGNVNAAASSVLNFLSANPTVSVGPQVSSLLSSLEANTAGTVPTAAASSLLSAASSVAASPSAGFTGGVSVGGSASTNPDFSALISSLLRYPVVTASPALSSAISSLAANPTANVAPALSSILSSIAANPTASLPAAAVSSIVSAVSSGASRPGSTTAPGSSASTPASCAFANNSTYTVAGSTFELFCNQFYGGEVLNLRRSLWNRQAIGSLNQCANICATNSACLGTQLDTSSRACTYYSSLTNGVSRNGIQFALRSTAASSISPPPAGTSTQANSGVTASAPNGSGVPSSLLSSLASDAATATGPLGSQLSSLVSRLSTASSVNTGALSSIISQISTASSLPGGLLSSVVDPVATSRLSQDLSSLSSVLATATGPVASQLSSLVSQISTGAPVDSSALSSFISGLPTATAVPTNIVSSVVNVGVTSGRIPTGIFSSVIGQITRASSLNPSMVSSIISDITAIPTSVLPSDAASSLISDVSAIATATDPSSVVSSIQNEQTSPASSMASDSSSIMASMTSNVGTIPTSILPSDVVSSILGGSSSGVSAIPTSLIPTSVLSSVLAGVTATTVSCNGDICLSLGVGPTATVTLGINLGGGSPPAITAPGFSTASGNAQITATTTSCNGIVCLALGLGPSATVTLGAIGTDGSIVDVSAGLGGSATTQDSALPTITSGADITATTQDPALPTTISGAEITATTTSCNGLLCLALGFGPSATVTLGAIGTDGSIVDVSAGIGAPSATSAVANLPTTVSGAEITATATTCDSLLCLALGIGPSATVTLGAIGTDGSIVDVSAALGGLATTTPSVNLPTTISGAEITATTSTCDSLVCLALGIGPSATVTLGAIGRNGNLADVSAGLGNSAIITPSAFLPTTVSGAEVTATTTSCNGLVCLALGLGPLATVTLGAVNSDGSIVDISAGLGSMTTPAPGLPTTISGAEVTATTTSCDGLVCLALGVGPLATVTLGAVNSDGSIVDISAGLGATTTPAPVLPTTISGAEITATTTSCDGLVCLALGVGPLATVTLGAVNSDGSIVDVSADIGPTTTPAAVLPTTVSGAEITATTTSCDGLLCVSLGIGPLATVTLGAINSNGLVGASAGLGGSVTAPAAFVPTTVSGAEITATTTSCDGLLCVSLGIGPLATVTLGAINSNGLVGASAGLGGAITTAAAFVPTTVSGALVTATTTSCNDVLCVSLGLGPLATVTLGAIPTNSAGLIDASVGLGGSVTAPAAFVPTTISGALVTATTTSCDDVLCVSLGLGPLATVTLGVIPTASAGLIDASVGLGGASPITTPALATPTTISGAEITATTTSCNNALCVTLGVGPLATVTLGALPNDGSGLIDVSAGIGASATTPAAVVPTTISGAVITATSTTCNGLLCASVGVGPLATVTLGLLNPSGVAGLSLGALGGRSAAAPTTLATVYRS